MMASAVGLCFCAQRRQAQSLGEFGMAWEVGGWVFVKDPSRHVSNPWRSSYYGTDNHDGEPYVWTVCPFCGHPLPHVSLTETTVTDAELHDAERGPLPKKGYRKRPPDQPPPPAEFCNPEE